MRSLYLSCILHAPHLISLIFGEQYKLRSYLNCGNLKSVDVKLLNELGTLQRGRKACIHEQPG